MVRLSWDNLVKGFLQSEELEDAMQVYMEFYRWSEWCRCTECGRYTNFICGEWGEGLCDECHEKRYGPVIIRPLSSFREEFVENEIALREAVEGWGQDHGVYRCDKCGIYTDTYEELEDLNHSSRTYCYDCYHQMMDYFCRCEDGYRKEEEDES